MTTAKEDLPIGTTPDTEKLHTRIRRICYVLLFGLVLEGAFVTPLSLIWFGWPQLSVKQICTGLEQNMYSDKHLQCQSYSLTDAPPFGPVPKDIQHTPTNDTWGATPTPHYARIGFRQLVKEFQHQSGQSAPATGSAASNNCRTTTRGDLTGTAKATATSTKCPPPKS